MTSSPSTYSSQRIVHNTLLLYGRMLFTMWLNLWATRLTLQNLGVDDLGTFGVVGSVVSMFGVFTNGLTTAIQRFITFELGRGREGRTSETFCTSLNVLLLLSVAMVVLLEVGGLWVLNHRLNIPAESLPAARWVFQFTIVTFVFNIIAIPYNALIIAHERMGAFASISVLQVVLTCVAAWMLSFFSEGRLIVYGAATAVIAVLVRLIYQVYCHRQFCEARYRWLIDRQQIGEMSRFAGVSTLSGIFQLISGEGIALVINWTFGVTLNAVYAIALQLKNMVLSFALNLFKALQPQITKTYAEGNLEVHQRLVYSGSKLEVYLIYVLMLPFLCRTQQVMELWLGDVPAYAVSFVQGTIFISLTYAAFEPIRSAILATGRITRFMLIPEGLYLLVLPLSWGVARLTGSPSWMLVSIVVADVLVCGVRVWLGAQVSTLQVTQIIRQILLPAGGVLLLDAAGCWLLSGMLPQSEGGLLLLAATNLILIFLLVITLGLSADERKLLAHLRQAFVR